MQNSVLRFLAIAIVYGILSISCSEQAQDAAEHANQDTVPVIETQPDKDTISSNSPSADSIRSDTANAR